MLEVGLIVIFVVHTIILYRFILHQNKSFHRKMEGISDSSLSEIYRRNARRKILRFSFFSMIIYILISVIFSLVVRSIG